MWARGKNKTHQAPSDAVALGSRTEPKSALPSVLRANPTQDREFYFAELFEIKHRFQIVLSFLIN
jgi:hypothetical protein